MTPEESERQRRKIQKQLDDALEDSFPASDPVSIVTSQEEEDWGEAKPGEGESVEPPEHNVNGSGVPMRREYSGKL
jgi:hypothetical protein